MSSSLVGSEMCIRDSPCCPSIVIFPVPTIDWLLMVLTPVGCNAVSAFVPCVAVAKSLAFLLESSTPPFSSKLAKCPASVVLDIWGTFVTENVLSSTPNSLVTRNLPPPRGGEGVDGRLWAESSAACVLELFDVTHFVLGLFWLFIHTINSRTPANQKKRPHGFVRAFKFHVSV